MLRNDHIISRPGLSTPAAARICPAALEFCLQLHIGHGIDHGHDLTAVIQRPLNPLDVTVLLQQFNGIHLAHRVRSDILT